MASPRRLAQGLGVVATLGAVAGLAWAGRGLLPKPPPPPPQKVLLIGVDGATWKVIGPMLDAGELPTFRKLYEEGASDIHFDSLRVAESPIVWTSVATGQRPEQHGIRDYTETLPDGSKVPITSNHRRVPALWNLATDNGKTVDVINWWASWPAEPVNGVVLSDHANPAAAGWMAGKYWTADPAKLGALHEDTWPADLGPSLTRFWVDPAVYPLAELQARSGLNAEQMALAAEAPFNERNTWSWLKTFYALDQPDVAVTLDLLDHARADLTMLYLRGPDPVQHYAWDTVEPRKYKSLPPTLDRDKGVVQGVYRYVDSFLAELIAKADAQTTVIVLSDHGAEPVKEARSATRTVRPGGHTARAKGVLFVWGPGVKKGAHLDHLGPLDIAPTVAWLMGLPLATDLPGKVVTAAFEPAFAENRGQATVSTWGTRTVDVGAASAADASMMEQLRGLGYVQ